MRKLLWLVPLFFAIHGLATIVSGWSWFFLGVKLIDPYTELHAVVAFAGVVLVFPTAAVAAMANE